MNLDNKEHIIKQISSLYQKILLREPDKQGLDYFFAKIVNENFSIEELQSHLLNSPEGKGWQKKREEFEINSFERKIFSQHGEDGILDFIFSMIDTTNKFSLEIGCDDGRQCNTRYFLENGWKGILIDNFSYKRNFSWINPVSKHKKISQKSQEPSIPSTISPFLKKETVTMENINKILAKYSVPPKIDLLSIDIDYNTFWIWKAIEVSTPRVVVVEYNSSISISESKVVKYLPEAEYDWTNYFGASLLAFVKLGKEKGYSLVGCDSAGSNAFFISDDEIKKNKIKTKSIEELYRKPQFGDVFDGIPKGWPISNKIMDEY